MKTVELRSIFDVEYGNKLDLNKMTTASEPHSAVAFVGRSGRGNGVSAYVQPIDAIQPYASGLITVALGGAILSSFVQPFAFYTAQNVAVLTPPEDMLLSEKIYYCLCIKANRHRNGAFGREANRTLRNLLVPSRADVPDWVKNKAKSVFTDMGAFFEELDIPASQVPNSRRRLR